MIRISDQLSDDRWDGKRLRQGHQSNDARYTACARDECISVHREGKDEMTYVEMLAEMGRRAASLIVHRGDRGTELHKLQRAASADQDSSGHQVAKVIRPKELPCSSYSRREEAPLDKQTSWPDEMHLGKSQTGLMQSWLI